MIDHLTLIVQSVPRSRDFYTRALEPLGYTVQMDLGATCGLGPGKPVLWLASGERSTPMHLAFAARTRAAVDAFHEAALRAGGKDNGGPGVREHYHPSYYGAFAIDPDGHNVEAVCHEPSGAALQKPKLPARRRRPPVRSSRAKASKPARKALPVKPRRKPIKRG